MFMLPPTLHMVSFEIFVKSMPPKVWILKEVRLEKKQL